MKKSIIFTSASVLIIVSFAQISSSCKGPTPPDPPIQQYTLSVAASPSNGGSVTKSPDQTQYASGTYVTITATASSGYSFTGWQGDASGTINPLMIALDRNTSITAVFTSTTPQYTLTVVASPSNGGFVTKYPNQALYAYGAQVILMATANSGYSFSEWQGDATGSSSQNTITMDGNKSITAVYIPRTAQYTLSVVASPSNGGFVTKSPDQTQYASGTVVYLTATANAGYSFSGWQGDISGPENPTYITMNGNRSITGVFTTVVTTPHILVYLTDNTVQNFKYDNWRLDYYNNRSESRMWNSSCTLYVISKDHQNTIINNGWGWSTCLNRQARALTVYYDSTVITGFDSAFTSETSYVGGLDFDTNVGKTINWQYISRIEFIRF